MSGSSLFFILALCAALAITVPPLGAYLAQVYDTTEGAKAPGDRVFRPIERLIYRLTRVDEKREQRWSTYTISLLAFSLMSLLAVYLFQRFQTHLPFNPTSATAVNPAGAFNVAVSFMTNTNWQWYSGEVAMSHLTQMVGLTVQNFVSAGAGMAVLVALIRGISRRGQRTLGNFWVDMTRSIVRVLIPLSLIFAVVLISRGVIQNFHGATTAHTIEGATQSIPGGPVASQEAIKQIGSNGGGFFNANSAHPFENPDGWSNFIELWAILAIPFGFALAYGRMVGDRRQGKLLITVMIVMWAAFSGVAVLAEGNGNPRLATVGVDQSISTTQAGGNMEGKDVRFGPAECGTWAGATTGTSNGSVNCMHDSFTPLGGLSTLSHMMLGEVSPGGLGVGLMGLLIHALLAVFIAGLMVGRTPEYLGKKVQAAEMKLVTIYILMMPIALLVFAAASVMLKSAQASILNPGAHGLSEVLYAYASAANNNGSAFAGLNAGTQWYTITQGIAMLIGRFGLIIPALAIGGSFVRKQRVPETSGTFPTHTALYGVLVLGVVVIVAGLTFFPALALGPIVEHLSL